MCSDTSPQRPWENSFILFVSHTVRFGATMINGDYRGLNASVIKHNQSALGDRPAIYGAYIPPLGLCYPNSGLCYPPYASSVSAGAASLRSAMQPFLRQTVRLMSPHVRKRRRPS